MKNFQIEVHDGLIHSSPFNVIFCSLFLDNSRSNLTKNAGFAAEMFSRRFQGRKTSLTQVSAELVPVPLGGGPVVIAADLTVVLVVLLSLFSWL